MTVYCVNCDHPIDCHDVMTGKCHALDVPSIGHIDDCACPGLGDADASRELDPMDCVLCGCVLNCDGSCAPGGDPP